MDPQPPRPGVTRVRSMAIARHSVDGIAPPSSSATPSNSITTSTVLSPREKHIADRLAYKKALDRLGLDPSREKLKEQLGLQEEELNTADRERRRAIEALIEKERHRIDAQVLRDKAAAAKALETLGYDPSKEKVIQTLGINERDLKQAELQKMQHFEELMEQHRKRTDSKVKQDKVGHAKAFETLGYDPSKEKVKDTLGLDEIQLHQAEENKRLVHEELIHKQREKNDAKHTTDKVSGAKAFNKLGIDLSKEKLVELLGISERELEDMNEVKIQRLAEVLNKDWERTNHHLLCASHENKSSKALEVMGYDPSKEKVKSTLGLDDSELAEAEKEKVMALKEWINKERAKKDTALLKDRTVLQPALERLGYDPSAEKLKAKLGMDDDDMETAKLQKIEVVNEIIGKEREKNDQVLSRDVRVTSKKAIDKLGYDPSDKKLKAKLGLDDNTLQAAKSESAPGTSPKLKKKSSATAIISPPVPPSKPKDTFKSKISASVAGCLNRSANW